MAGRETQPRGRSGSTSRGYRGYSDHDLITSSWLYKVDGYEYEGIIFVIAQVKRKNSLLKELDTYIFCGISKDDWESFKDRFPYTILSIGEKFKKYIYDYKCNCY
jgi:hypothetical protein